MSGEDEFEIQKRSLSNENPYKSKCYKIHFES